MEKGQNEAQNKAQNKNQKCDMDKNKKKMKIYTTVIIVLIAIIAVGKFGKHTVADYMEAGDKYYAEAKYEDAFDSYMRAIGLDSMAVEAYESAARTLMTMDRQGEAEDILKRGVQETEDSGLEAMLMELRGRQ